LLHATLNPISHVPSRPQNFDQVVNGNQFVLVDFYSPTCSACQTFYPKYLAAAAQLKFTYSNSAVMAKVDAVSTPGGEALADKFNVTGFPTLIWFVNGKPQPYDGLMIDPSDVLFWVVSKTDLITRALTQQVFTPIQAFSGFKLKPNKIIRHAQALTLKMRLPPPKKISRSLPPSGLRSSCQRQPVCSSRFLLANVHFLQGTCSGIRRRCCSACILAEC
jgi:thiol-disulfide isomerase/thioredoxin